MSVTLECTISCDAGKTEMNFWSWTLARRNA